MKLGPATVISQDVLVIGGGGAGLRAAIEARKEGATVLLVCKSRVGFGNNTAISKGAFAAVVGQGMADNSEVHLRDTVVGGRFVNNQRLVEAIVLGGPQQVADLQSYSVDFNKLGEEFDLESVPGHTNPRIVSCQRGLGIGFTIPLRAFAVKSGVQFAENVLITRLLVEGGVVLGALGIDKGGRTFAFYAKSTILACGGLGQIYLNTNNAAGTTGDGYVLAYNAGTSLADMEFVQFYPTALGQRGARIVLYEVFVFREGGIIRNSLGEDVLASYNLGDAATLTRDRVSRVLMQEVLAGRSLEGKLILDLSRLTPERRDSLRNLLPSSTSPQKMQFLVSPTTHHAMGGVRIDTNGATELQGLFAAGEICSGMHGGNRLAGNAITEILVMGAIAGRTAAGRAGRITAVPRSPVLAESEVSRLAALGSPSGTTTVKELKVVLKETMWYQVGIVRDKEGLERALAEIDSLEQAYPTVAVANPQQLWEAMELGNMLTVSRMVCLAALKRTESRGAHYRRDFPEENNEEWLKNIVISQKQNKMVLFIQPVEMVKIAP